MDENELIRKYAKEIERIIAHNTAGDYTWNGLLFSFLREVDESRTLKYEVETFDGDTVDKFSVLQNVTAPVQDEENRYYDIHYFYDDEWHVYCPKLPYDHAESIMSTFTWEGPVKMVDHGTPLSVHKSEKTYDVHVHDGWWRLLASNVSKDVADALVKDLTIRYLIEEHDDGGPIYDGDEVPDGCDKW